jgi:hypothetical protein
MTCELGSSSTRDTCRRILFSPALHRDNIPNSFFWNNFAMFCPFILVIVLSASSGGLIHLCNWSCCDIFFNFIMQYE